MLERLYALDTRRGWDLNLESGRATLLELGSPEAGLETLHVAGTNGKGSVAAFAHSVLLASGASAGLYTSPHLEDFCERIRLGDREITPGEVVGLIEEVERGAARAGVELTFFELTTVAALLAFARQPSRPAIVEVGLGGRLDATNVLAPRVTVITTVALDHESFLGSDLTMIAREKAGIVKPGTPLVLGRIDGEALAAIEEIAQAAGAPIRRLGRDFSISPGTDGLVYESDRLRTGLHPGLAGAFGADNAAVALAALEAGGWLEGVGHEAVRRGISGVRWPGRLERIGRVLLDGAHNPAAAQALVPEVQRLAAGRPVHLIYGTLGDKRWREVAAALRPLAREVTLVPIRNQRRAEAPEALREAFPGAAVAASAPDAVETAIAGSEAVDGLVLVAGSLFLVGEVRRGLVE